MPSTLSQSMACHYVFNALSSVPSKVDTSRITELRNSNAYPHSQERDELFSILQSNRQRSNAIVQRITQLQAQLVDLTREKENVDALVSDLSIILHPLRTVPQEILSEIFAAVAHMSSPPTTLRHTAVKLVDSLNKSAPGWVLSKVSSRWRHAALSTSSLWTTVFLQLRDKQRHSAPLTNLSSFFLLSTFLARSGNKKLSVHIRSNWALTDLISNPAMAALLMTCQRWQHASIALCYKGFGVLTMCPALFSSLTKLSLGVYDRVPSNDVDRIENLFDHAKAPYLQILSLTEPALLSFFGIHPNIRHFSHIKASDWAFDEYQWHSENIQMLSRLPSLKWALFVAQPTPVVVSNQVGGWLPSLQHVFISGTGGGIQDLCRRIKAPALTHLYVTCTLSLDTLFTGGTAPLLPTSHNITNLRLSIESGSRSEVAALESALNQMSTVAYLTLIFGTILNDTSKVLKALNASATPVIAPALKELVLEARYGSSVTADHSLVDMIVSRRYNLKEGVSTLEKVSIDYAGKNKSAMSFNDLPLDDFQRRTYTKLLIQ